jgi:hypothetical protein
LLLLLPLLLLDGKSRRPQLVTAVQMHCDTRLNSCHLQSRHPLTAVLPGKHQSLLLLLLRMGCVRWQAIRGQPHTEGVHPSSHVPHQNSQATAAAASTAAVMSSAALGLLRVHSTLQLPIT